jgi:hypothetical protein
VGEHSHAELAEHADKRGKKWLEEGTIRHPRPTWVLLVHLWTKIFGATEEGCQISCHMRKKDFSNFAHGRCKLGSLAATAVDVATIGKEQKASPS